LISFLIKTRPTTVHILVTEHSNLTVSTVLSSPLTSTMPNMFPEFSAPVAGSQQKQNRGNRGRSRPSGQRSRLATLADVRRIVDIAQEPKFFDSKEYAQSATTTPTQLAISAVPQGDTDSTRDGDQINLKSLWVKFETYLQGTGGTNDFTDQVRLMIYRYHPMSSGAAPVPATVLQDLSVAQSATMTPNTWDNRKDYTVILDETFNLSGNGPSDIGFSKKFDWGTPGIPAHFSAGSTTLQTNGLFAMIMSDSLVATHPQFNFYSRVVYSDA
jgi:hypothetical protein